mmetsp:Transcript_28352/g.59098  ORF Transcript_28352/g.59098 Transcript_28352/m.59098 type:complete len:306 (+) Transcript_28352:775-1692(+)
MVHVQPRSGAGDHLRVEGGRGHSTCAEENGKGSHPARRGLLNPLAGRRLHTRQGGAPHQKDRAPGLELFRGDRARHVHLLRRHDYARGGVLPPLSTVQNEGDRALHRDLRVASATEVSVGAFFGRGRFLHRQRVRSLSGGCAPDDQTLGDARGRRRRALHRGSRGHDRRQRSAEGRVSPRGQIVVGLPRRVDNARQGRLQTILVHGHYIDGRNTGSLSPKRQYAEDGSHGVAEHGRVDPGSRSAAGRVDVHTSRAGCAEGARVSDLRRVLRGSVGADGGEVRLGLQAAQGGGLLCDRSHGGIHSF